MDFFTGFFSAFGGVGLAYLGSALAVGLCCVGSAKGTGMTGEAATGVIAETPEHFSKCMYGIVAWFMVMLKIGVFGGELAPLTIEQGLAMFGACIPIALGGLLSAIAQGRVATASINIVAKKPEESTKGIILCGIVEFYAILSLLATILMVMMYNI